MKCKTISIVTIVSFLWQGIAWAQPKIAYLRPAAVEERKRTAILPAGNSRGPTQFDLGADPHSNRQLFIDLLHLLNKNWWLIQDPKNGYRDKEAFSIDLKDNSLNETAILRWSGYEFQGQENEESKIKIAERIINNRIAMGKLKYMPREDQDRLLELAVKLGIRVDTRLQEHLGPEEAKKASFDDISVILSKIDISPEEARARLGQNRKDKEEYLMAYPFYHNKGPRRFTSHTREEKKNILRILLPLLAEVQTMPMDTHFSCEHSIGLMIEAQSRLGLYDLAEKTIEDTLTHNQHLLRPVNNEDKEETIRRFRSRNMLRIAKARLMADDFESACQLLHPTDAHYSWDKMTDRSEEAMALMTQAGLIKDVVKYLRNESAEWWESKRRCEVAENLARIDLFDAAVTLVNTDTQPEHEVTAKAEIGIQMARAGDIDRARLILTELTAKDEEEFYKGPDSLMDIARLQQAVGVDRKRMLETLTACETEMGKIRNINFLYRMKLAKVYFAIEPAKAQKIVSDEKERFFHQAPHWSSSDCFKSDFIKIFDTILEFGMYDEAQDILNRYREFRKHYFKKEDSNKRVDFLDETEYRLWQRMVDARNGNKKPPMNVSEEIYFDFHGNPLFYFVDTYGIQEPLCASKLVDAVLKGADSVPEGQRRNTLDNVLYHILLYLRDSNPDETRLLLREMIGEVLEKRDAEDTTFVKSVMIFFNSDFGKALYEDDNEYRENAGRFISKFLPKLSRLYASDVGLSSIEFRDDGDAVTNYPNFMKGMLNFALPRMHEKPQGLPAKEKILPDNIPIIKNEGTNLVINGYSISLGQPANLIGRTLEYRVDGKAIMLKFLKKDEDPANLAYEYDMMNFLCDRKKEWDLWGTYPRGILRLGKIRCSLFADHLPFSIVGEHYRFAKDEYLTCMAYEVPLDENGQNPYAIYLNDPAIKPADFKKAYRVNVHDRFVMARHGLFDMEIIELFHNREAADGRRYDWMVDMRHHQGERHGAGRLHNITGATLYPNVRLSGPADLASLAFIGNMIENSEVTALADNRFRRLLNMFERDKEKAHNYIASALLGDTLLSLALIPPIYLERREELDYRTESRDKRTDLQESIKILFDESYRGYNRSEPPYTALGLNLDSQLIARQMAYFLTDRYVVDYHRRFKRRPIPQDLFPGAEITQIEEGRGWRRGRGWDISDGIVYEIPTIGEKKIQRTSRDLGPVNGANPLQGLIRALYTTTPIMTINPMPNSQSNTSLMAIPALSFGSTLESSI